MKDAWPDVPKIAPLYPPFPPEPGWKTIASFKYDSNLHVVRLKNGIPSVAREAQYIVAKDYRVSFDLDGVRNSITVPRGMLTDFASVPKWFRSIVGRVGPHLEASIVHDYLYIAWQIAGIRPTDDMRRFADELMLEAMKAARMRFKSMLIYGAVRAGGHGVFYKKDPPPLIVPGNLLAACCCRKGELDDDASNGQGNERASAT